MFDFDKFFETFWALYDKKYTDNAAPKKGSKELARDSAKRKIKTQEMADMCIQALTAQKRYWDRARAKNKWMPNFPMVSTWFNQKRWAIELDSHVEISDRPAHKQAQKPNLGKVTDFEAAKNWREEMKRKARGL